MVSAWLLPLVALAGAAVGAVATWAYARFGSKTAATSPLDPGIGSKSGREAEAPPPLGIDVEGALRDLEERYRGRRVAGDEEEPPKRPRRRREPRS